MDHFKGGASYAVDNLLNGKDNKRYSGLGMVPPTSWMDTMGPMARTVEDVAFLDAVITGDEVPTVRLKGVRIGIPRPDYWEKRPHDPEVRLTTELAFSKLRDAGAVLIEVDLNGLIELSEQDRLGPAVTKGARPLEDWLAENLPSVTVEDVEAERTKNRTTPEPKNYFRRIPEPIGRRPMTLEEQKEMVADAWDAYSSVFRDNRIVALAMPTMNILPTIVDFSGHSRGKTLLVNGEFVEG